jgi:hypothetical protein
MPVSHRCCNEVLRHGRTLKQNLYQYKKNFNAAARETGAARMPYIWDAMMFH